MTIDMRRVASHFLYWNGLHRMYYVELSDDGSLVGVNPLVEEIDGTEFYDGILLPVLSSEEKLLPRYSITFTVQSGDVASVREQAAETVLDFLKRPLAGLGEQVTLWVLQLPASEFGTDDGRGNGYIQRL